MDSINVAKGYGKVGSLEDPSSTALRPSASRKRLIAVVIASIVILSAVIAVAIGVLIHESVTEGHEEEEETPNSSPPVSSNSNSSLFESIRTVCNYTEFPDSCFTSVSNSNSISKSNLSVTLLTNFDPEIVYSLSLQAAIDELVNLTSFPKTLISKYNNEPRTVSALNDCVELFIDGLSQLNNSADSIHGGGSAVTMTEKIIEDVKTWSSAAMTDLETCLDGLEEMESTALDEVRTRVQRSKEYISNSLAILSNMKPILDRFHLKLH